MRTRVAPVLIGDIMFAMQESRREFVQEIQISGID